MKRGLIILVLVISQTIGYSQYLSVPVMSDHKPEAGSRVKVIPEDYQKTEVYYSLYLPENYKPGNTYPVIVEYTGNEWPPSGSTGEVKDANLGYAIAKRIGAIWLVLPYIQQGRSVTKWWGDEVETVDFALKNIREVCENYGGNPAEIFLCGFSRGAIGVNYLGLYNDKIAEVWLGFFTHDHYDGVREWKGTEWGSPIAKYRQAAKERMGRLRGRNCLISQNIEEGETSFETRNYIEENSFDSLANIRYNWFSMRKVIPHIPSEAVPHSHTDKWLLYDSEYAETVYNWFLETIQSKPNTYSISGVIRNSKGKPLKGVVVESSTTHFAISNKDGEYRLEGLTAGPKKVTVFDRGNGSLRLSKEVYLEAPIIGLDFMIGHR
ncbi:carboxypeptidase family protein [Dyadobacter jejuensis]|uniref:Carboxypeptidase family protein n=1 Tax=Dyadobacter jejuensis TaxID=1082580 RepID=A0A316AA57_9BACT|nr:carboxypeptidase regulatory-like domain-containing protein [Dyadobacter jejuensis]PWJ54078.1 carboxypeptidase family protein [Dyadobacter jejuensis]